MQYTITIGILFVLMATTHAQQVVATAGETAKTTEYEVSWTVGETVTGTYSSGSHTITQGVLQGGISVVQTDESIHHPGITVSPNPTKDNIIIHTTSYANNLRYILFSMSGEKLVEKNTKNNGKQLNLESLPAGTYLLKLLNDKNQEIKTFKIIKK